MSEDAGTTEPWGARMGRLEADTGGECNAGALARDPDFTAYDLHARQSAMLGYLRERMERLMMSWRRRHAW